MAGRLRANRVRIARVTAGGGNRRRRDSVYWTPGNDAGTEIDLNLEAEYMGLDAKK